MTPPNKLLIEHIKNLIKDFEEKCKHEQFHLSSSEKDFISTSSNGALEVLSSYLTLDSEKVKLSAKQMAQHNLQENTPYILVINIIKSFKNDLLHVLLQDSSTQMASQFYALSNAAENCISQTYLNHELDKFIKFNKLRMQSIHRLTDINTLYLYDAHLRWLDELSISLKTIDISKIPELHPQKCIVGQWIESDAKNIITDEVILNEFTSAHKNLHLVAKRIELSFTQKPIDFHMLMLLLKKAELLSLTLGMELSIINNIRFQVTASKDPLTGALNRRLLFHIFSTQFELSRAIEKSFSMVMMDIDDFKKINDTSGHVEGDNVLRSFSAMILNNLRDSDFLIRYGGEEFLLILPSTELQDAVRLAEKLRTACHDLEGKDFLKSPISASFGVINISPTATDLPSEMLMSRYIQEVDKELYHAKSRGKDQVSSALNIEKRAIEE